MRVYCGVPAANSAFHAAKEVIGGRATTSWSRGGSIEVRQPG